MGNQWKAVLILFLFITNASAQIDITFERIHAEQGLSQSTVQCLFVDSRGLLWLGTQAGLNVYDGRRVISFLPDPDDTTAITQAEIMAICEDDRGNILIGGKKGIEVFDHTTDSFHLFPFPQSDGFEKIRFISAMTFDSHSKSAVFGSDLGVSRFTPADGSYSMIEADELAKVPEQLRRIGRVYVDSRGDTWFSSREPALYRIRKGTASVERFPTTREMAELIRDTESFLRISLKENETGFLVCAGRLGLYNFYPETGTWEEYDRNFNSIVQKNQLLLLSVETDAHGNLWLPTYGAGLIRLKKGSSTPEFFNSSQGHSGPGSDHFADVVADDSGVLWAGSVDSGLVKIRFNRFERYTSKDEIEFRPTEAVALSVTIDSDGILWAGSLAGVDRIDRVNKSVKHFDSLKIPGGTADLLNVTYLEELDSEHMLVGGYPSGLFKMNKKTGRAEPIIQQAFVVNCHLINKQYLWIAAATAGVLRFDLETGEKLQLFNDPDRTINLEGKIVQFIREDADKSLWIGTTSGLLHYFPEQDRLTVYSSDSENARLNSDDVLNVYPAGNGTVWAGTSGGLHRIDTATGTIRLYTTNNGLPNNTVYAINADSLGRLWVATNRGLAMLEPETESFTPFDTGDGLASMEFNQSSTWLTAGGEMAFGSMEGINTFYPERLQKSAWQPPIIVNTIEAGRAAHYSITGYWADQPLQLSYEQRDLKFYFTGLDMRNPADLEYQYMLEGYDNSWKNSGRLNFANYTNLPPGPYSFKVRSTNADGVWNDNVTSISFRVIPIFWQTLWFQSLVALACVIAISGVFLWRINTISKQRDLLSQKVDEATRELQKLASMDDLTGVSNRRHFMERMQEELSRMKRYDRPAALLMLDIDNFKSINDAHGHSVGDVALVLFAETCMEGLRETDLFGRLGGEEFAALLVETELDKAYQIAERLRSMISSVQLQAGEQAQTSFTVSIGITEVRDSDESIQEIIWRADNALYAAKNQGRDQVVVFHHDVLQGENNIT